ncbi:MAG: LysR family transcriptional regulator [Oscillospiraceae bacterium]|nr:LysR family transcriptional regulator [Oscillospiraceae bacterium]
MTLRHFQIFQAVCDTGSATGASDKLNISQPAVSIAIKELEVFYNTKLFERVGRKLQLTESGKTLRGHVNNVLEQFDETTTVMKEQIGQTRVRLGSNTSAAETKLPSLIDSLKESIPDIKLTILADNTEAILEKLMRNEIDFALINEQTNNDQLVSIPLYCEEIRVYCSPDLYNEDMITFERLKDMPLLFREKGSFVRETICYAAERYSSHLKPVVESTSTLSLITLAKRGM